MSRQDQARVTLSVDGRPIGVFSKREGGGTDSEEAKYFPGGMEPQEALGGSPTVDNVTLTKLYRLTDAENVRFLRGRAGKGECTCVDQQLDADGQAFGKPDVWRGKLKMVKAPDRDSNANDAAEIEIEISTHGTVG